MPSAAGRFRSLPHRQALRLALPAIASNVTVPIVGLIDTGVVGHFASAADLGAVGLGAAVIASVFWAFSFLRPGTTSLVGRAIGAGRGADAVTHLQRALAMAVGLGLAWAALQWAVVPVLVDVLAGDAAAGPLAQDYALVRGLSLPAVLVTLAVVGYLIGTQDTRTPLGIAGVVAFVNAAMCVWFVAGLGAGAVGSAWATFAAEWTGAAVALALLRLRLGRDGWRLLGSWRSKSLRKGWRALLSMNAHLVVRTALLMVVVTATASLGSRFGDATLAANAILLQMMYLASYALDGYATAAETMAASSIGARRQDEFHRSNLASSLAGAAIAAALSLVFWACGDGIVRLLTGLPDVAAVAHELWWVVAVLPLVSVGGWILDGIFLGAGRTRDMLWSMAASTLLGYVALLAVASMLGAFTNPVLWIAFLAMNVLRAATLGWRYAVLTRRSAWV